VKDLTPRLIEESESKKLGIPHGWYGTRVSGTFMTGPCASLDECLEAIRLLPEVAAKLATAINNLYVIGYRAPESFLSGKWRRVKIRLENPSGARLRVATRSGYFPD